MMGVKLEELYKMSIEDVVKKLNLADVKIRNNGNDIVAIELRYEDKDITQAVKCEEKEGRNPKW